jgi:hypothetical protein
VSRQRAHFTARHKIGRSVIIRPHDQPATLLGADLNSAMAAFG